MDPCSKHFTLHYASSTNVFVHVIFALNFIDYLYNYVLCWSLLYTINSRAWNSVNKELQYACEKKNNNLIDIFSCMQKIGLGSDSIFICISWLELYKILRITCMQVKHESGLQNLVFFPQRTGWYDLNFTNVYSVGFWFISLYYILTYYLQDVNYYYTSNGASFYIEFIDGLRSHMVRKHTFRWKYSGPSKRKGGGATKLNDYG